MGSYIDRALISGETVLHRGRVSLWSIAPILFLGVLLLPLFGLGLIFLAQAWIRYKTTELAITDKRVVAKFGFIRRDTIEININKIESI
jgi:uncharacterized membrane protein YdbT with pleckstrin-like domain